MHEPTPLVPQRPELPPKPRGSCLVLLAVLFGLIAAVILTFLMIGFFWPFVVGFAVLSIIALQYVVWGWWFEKIYRSGPTDETSSAVEREQ